VLQENSHGLLLSELLSGRIKHLPVSSDFGVLRFRNALIDLFLLTQKLYQQVPFLAHDLCALRIE
jgi:hypothetical protein